MVTIFKEIEQITAIINDFALLSIAGKSLAHILINRLIFFNEVIHLSPNVVSDTGVPLSGTIKLIHKSFMIGALVFKSLLAATRLFLE